LTCALRGETPVTYLPAYSRRLSPAGSAFDCGCDRNYRRNSRHECAEAELGKQHHVRREVIDEAADARSSRSPERSPRSCERSLVNK
jgi:hypothetical protein